MISSANHISKNGKCVIDIETTSFQPWDGKIICIGIMDITTKEKMSFHEGYEEALLINFFRYVNKKNYQEIIGYNLPFDMRYIFVKCIRYQIPTYGFLHAKQTDLMMLLKSVKPGYNFNKPGTLNDWAKSILGKEKLFQNTQIADLYDKGRIDDIIEYNMLDVELTYELWMKIRVVMKPHCKHNHTFS